MKIYKFVNFNDNNNNFAKLNFNLYSIDLKLF